MTSRLALGLVFGSLTTIFAVGCTAPTTDENNDDVQVGIESSAKPLATLTAGVCPDPTLSKEKQAWYQAKATAVVGYVFGAKSPFTYDEVTYNSECKAAYECSTLLRKNLQPKGLATVSPAGATTVCGLPAGIYSVNVSSQMSWTDWQTLAECGGHMDGCWGTGVSGFYHAHPDQKSRIVYLDPEPAHLVQDLVGSTGATAAAVYSTTLSDVKALKWPGSYVSSAYPPPAGTPCSTTDLAAGTDTVKMIQGSGSYRRCY